jgi:hypothetical protein
MSDSVAAAWRILAERAGLETALTAFPEDVQAAVAAAERAIAALQIPASPAAEPWPAMRLVPGG